MLLHLCCQDEDVDVSRFGGNGPSGTSITLQLPTGDQLQLLLPVSLPLLPAGQLLPGEGLTPPKDLPPLLGDLPSHDGQYDDDDDEKEEDEDEDNGYKDNN